MNETVGAIGAVLVIGSAMIGGLRVHLLAIRHAPGIAAVLPRDAGVIVGLVVGVLTVARWIA